MAIFTKTPDAWPSVRSVRLPLQFILFGFVALLAGIGLIMANPEVLATYHYNQHVISVTHLLVLGWLGAVVMGAMYQLVPVALETKLHSERLGHWQFFIYVIGVVGMVEMLWFWNMKAAGNFGFLVIIAVGMFVGNLVRTLQKISRWNVVAVAVAASLFWLSFGVLAGLYIAFSKFQLVSPFGALAQMHAHAHLGAIGFFMQLLIGVSYKLVPMFALSETKSSRRAWWSIGLLNAGLAGAFVTILRQHWSKFLFAAVIVIGLVVYGWEILAIVRARKRRFLDWGVKYFLTALGLLIPLSMLALILSWPSLPLCEFTGQLENLYGFLGFIGVLTFAILGMLYKIVPFLVWHGSYSGAIGRGKIPALADLYSSRLQSIGYFLFLGGLFLASWGIGGGSSHFVRCGCLILTASLSLFAVNLVKILFHLFHPQIEPLPMRTALGNL